MTFQIFKNLKTKPSTATFSLITDATRCGRITYHIGYPSSILDPRDPNQSIVQGALLATYYEDLCSGCQPNKETAYRGGSADGGQSGERSEGSNRNGDARPDHASRTGREETNENPFSGQAPAVTRNATATLTGTPINKTSIEPSDKNDYLAKGEILKNSNSTFFNVSEIFDKDESPMDNRNSSYLFSTWQLFKYFIAKSGGSSSPSLSALNFTHQQPNQTQRQIKLETGIDCPACNSNLSSNLSFSSSSNATDLAGLPAAADSSASAASTATELSPGENGKLPIGTFSPPTATKVHLSANAPEIATATGESSSEIAAKTNKCPGLEIDCSEFSIDKMLAVRLCCLNGSSLLSKGNGFSCRRFDRTECSKVLPIIKCCLRDLSEILEDYFAKKDVKNER